MSDKRETETDYSYHVRKAEELLAQGAETALSENRGKLRPTLLQAAQVHATLAVAMRPQMR